MTRIVGFNYEALDAGVRSETQENAQAIRGLVRQATASVIEIGKRHFGAWLRAEFRWSQSVASNYMLAATKFGNLDEYVINNIQPTAMFALGREVIPEHVVNEALDAARAGELVTRKVALAIIQKHRTGVVTPDLVTVMRKYILKLASKLGANFVADRLLEIAGELRASANKVA